MILRTDAVVLRALRYGETSRIVTLFTRDHGKMAVLARGARTTKSRLGSTVQPLAHVQAVVSYRPTRTLQTLREASHVVRFPTVAADLGRLSTGLRMVELTNALLQDEEAAPAVFDLLAGALDGLDRAEGPAASALLLFEVHLAGLLGFTARFTREAVAALPDEGGVLHLDTGEIGGPEWAGGGTLRASRAALRAFAVAARADADTTLRMRIADADAAEAVALAEAYLQYHTEDAFPTRSQDARRALDALGG